MANGGRLQMMRVGSRRALHDDVVLSEPMEVSWVDIEHPENGFTPGDRRGDGVVTQGIDAGGSAFVALEGCVFSDGRVYFTSKKGGKAGAGSVFEYDPDASILVLIYESPGHGRFSGPDNIIMSPRGSLVLCEDRMTFNTTGQRLAGLDAQGVLSDFAAINADLDQRHAGFNLYKTARESEWAGVCFSQDGEWMFANIYDPGISIAITGPWQEGGV